MIDFKKLITAGVHFGHQSSRWSPRMAPYIWGQKGGVHLVDVSKTAVQLEKAAKFLETVAAEGKTILWVGTKKPAQSIILNAATQSHCSYVTHRWIGGTLTNHSQIRKSITKYLHLVDVVKKAGEATHYTKKELNSFQKRIDRLEKNIGGILNLKWPIGAVVVVDVKKEHSVVKEASSIGIPVVGLVDTNSDPVGVTIVIPGNDDAPRSISCVIDYLTVAVQRGVEVAETKRKEEQERERVLLGERKKENAAKEAARAAEVKSVAAKTASVKVAAKVEAKPSTAKTEVKKTVKAEDKAEAVAQDVSKE